MAADGGSERDMVHGMNEDHEAWVEDYCEKVIVPTALYGAEACMRSAERRKVNVLEMKRLRSLVGVS